MVVSVPVIPFATDAPKTGSVSVTAPITESAVLACSAYGTLRNWLVPVIV